MKKIFISFLGLMLGAVAYSQTTITRSGNENAKTGTTGTTTITTTTVTTTPPATTTPVTSTGPLEKKRIVKVTPAKVNMMNKSTIQDGNQNNTGVKEGDSKTPN